jgi:hypothetical protein
VTAAGLVGRLAFVAEAVRRAFGLWSAEVRPSAVDDWSSLLDLVFREGLAPIVHAGTAGSGWELPVDVAARLRAGHAANRVRSQVWIEPTLQRALGALAAANVEPIVVKGAALAYTAYRDPAHRTLSDVDLLLDPGDLDLASRALRQAGFCARGSDPMATHHARPYYWGDGQIGVELHRDVLPRPNPYLVDLPAMRARARSARLGGVRARVLAPEDALHLACVHVAYAHHYEWFPLRALVDILAIVDRSAEQVDWDSFVRGVSAARTAGAVHWPLWLARSWLGAAIPTDTTEALAPPRVLGRLVGQALRPASLLEERRLPGPGGDVLFRVLVDASLRAGCPAGVQLGSAARGLFPPPQRVGHLPADVRMSPVRYAAFLARPRRLARGVLQFNRVLVQAVKEAR